MSASPRVSATARVYAGVDLGARVSISDLVIIGHPRESSYVSSKPSSPTRIGDDVVVLPFAIIYDGADIAAGVVIEERVKIGYEVSIGYGSRVTNGAIISDCATVGERCVIAGRVSERTVVGHDCQIMGSLMHSHGQPHVPWGIVEPAPKLGSRVVVGHGAVVIGGISIGSNVYVAANAVVTRDVPSRTVVVGYNVHKPAESWTGSHPDPGFWDWRGPGDGE